MAKAKWKNTADLEREISGFLEEAKRDSKPITRLALLAHLKITKEEMKEYRSGKHDTAKNRFSRVFELAELETERYAEELLLTRDKASNAIMFYLKNNFGWGEETAQATDGEIRINVKVV